ncbi:hypothetical protein MFLAVUS_001319 [Mucor flavus]|uniref:Transposase n=1 Tax=Mucor flavus TaxID=439312 RepID=A0ABP9YM51_9FUNG
MNNFVHEDGQGNLYNDEGLEVAVEMEVDEEISVGRPAKLGPEHETFLTELVDEQPSLVLDQIMDSLTNQFTGLQISKTGLYTFVTKNCRISLKRAHFHSVERNSPEKIENRFNWVSKWNETDLDYMSNCVFIDEAAFHINMKRSFAWSRVGTRAVDKVPKTRARTTTILGAISPHGVVNITVRRPRALSASKKRKTTGNTNNGNSNWSLFQLFEQSRSMLKAEVMVVYIYHHTHQNLIPLKLKRVPLLDEETLSTRIGDACNQILFSDLRGFCQYSMSKFDDCIERKPI